MLNPKVFEFQGLFKAVDNAFIFDCVWKSGSFWPYTWTNNSDKMRLSAIPLLGRLETRLMWGLAWTRGPAWVKPRSDLTTYNNGASWLSG